MKTTPNTLRSQADIVAELERIKSSDFFGFKTGDLLGYLDFEHAKPYLNDDAVAEKWTQAPSDRDSILNQMEEYMSFAWDKANSERSISAGRSLAHYTVWIWMIGDQGRFGDLEEYHYYGKDNLRSICDAYGWNADQWDDGIRTN